MPKATYEKVTYRLTLGASIVVESWENDERVISPGLVIGGECIAIGFARQFRGAGALRIETCNVEQLGPTELAAMGQAYTAVAALLAGDPIDPSALAH